MKRRILIVEDDEHIADAVGINLRLEGYDPCRVGSAEEAITYWERGGIELILLDVMLPGMDGFEFCRLVRAAGDRVPILFVTARDQYEDRIRGLEEGGDDYLTKPFALPELLARIKGIFRREEWYRAAPSSGSIRIGDRRVDLNSFIVSGPGGRATLKEKEAMILRLLVEKAGEPVDREVIIDRVWGYDAYPSTRTVDNFIVSLRKHLEPDPSSPQFILTVHGRGYRLLLPSGE